jgi:hypothetical protein
VTQKIHVIDSNAYQTLSFAPGPFLTNAGTTHSGSVTNISTTDWVHSDPDTRTPLERTLDELVGAAHLLRVECHRLKEALEG